MIRVFAIAMLFVLLAGLATARAPHRAEHEVNLAEPALLSSANSGQGIKSFRSVQIGRIWVPLEQTVLTSMVGFQSLSSPRPIKIGQIWVP